MVRALFSSDSEPEPTLEIDSAYARRFEHNKNRETLQRYDELKRRGEVPPSSTTSDSSSDDDIAGTVEKDAQFFDTLLKIKINDPSILNKDVSLFESDSEAEKVRPSRKKKEKEKPLYIKDVAAMRLLEDGPELASEEMPAKFRDPMSKVYSEEQEEKLRAFQQAVEEAEEGDSGDELFERKKRIEVESEDEEVKKTLEVVHEKVERVFEENEDDKYLKQFFKDKLWVDKSRRKEVLIDEEAKERFSEEEEELWEQDDYEKQCNFRYQEAGGAEIETHSRTVENSVRKKNDSRKKQRERKQERMAQAEQERKEFLKQVKNVKKKEIQKKLEQIRAVGGIGSEGACKLDEDDLEGEYDPQTFDRVMEKVYNKEYYDADEEDPAIGSDGDEDLEKPDFDKEDELLGLPKDWDVVGTGSGFAATRERVLKQKAKGNNVEEEEDNVEEEANGMEEEDNVEEEDQKHESKRKKKRKLSLREKVELEKELEEYYKLEYEDTIGDLKTRFKYKSVPSNRYGLSSAEILMTDDKELNQYVSLKKLAPYVQEEWKVPKIKRYQMKTKTLDEEEKHSGDKKKKHLSEGSTSKEPKSGVELELPTGEASTDALSKRAKRRRRQVELKLSESRLIAYGKVPATASNKKKKH